MKTFFNVLFMFVFFFSVANANHIDSLLISEDFTNAVVGDLSGQDGWMKGGSGPDALVADTNPIVFPGYDYGSGKYLLIDSNASSSSRVYKLLNDTTYSLIHPGTVIYYSLLLNLNTTYTTATGYFFTLGQGTNYFAKLFAKKLTDSTYQLGVSKTSNTANFVTREMKNGETYVVVVRYNVNNNATNQNLNTCYMWINPTSNVEPDTTFAEATVWAGQGDYTATALTSIMYHNRGTSNPLGSIDGIRVAASTVSSLQAWNDLAPGPLPVELTSFAASSINGKVVLNWQTASETNNKGFEVERKSDNNWISLGFVNGNGTSLFANNYSFTDNVTNGTYSYRLKQVDFNGYFKYTDVIEVVNGLPVEYTLSQNYPNPFNPATTIEFSVVKAGNYSLDVYSVSGEKVASLLNTNLNSGNHKINFDASNLTSGIYFYRLSGEGINLVNKMTLLK